MTKKIKKLALFCALSASSLLLAATFAVSCNNPDSNNASGNKNRYTARKDYDFGLTTEPITNLNYVRYRSMDKIVPSLVDSFIKSGPTSTVKTLLTTGKFYMPLVDTSLNTDSEPSGNFDVFYNASKENLEKSDGFGKVSTGFYEISNFQLVGGLGKAASAGSPQESGTLYAFRNPRNASNYMAFTGNLNDGKNVWSNGDIVTANDIRDYLQYIFDLNTGSQKLDQVLKFGIRGAEEFINAQKDYVRKFNRSYQNPWGRRKYILAPWSTETKKVYIQDPNQKVWESQTFDKNNNPIDKLEVQAIKDAALKFSFYTGQYFLDYSNEEIAKNLKLNPNFDPLLDSQPFKIIKNDKEYDITLVRDPFANPYQEYAFDKENGFSSKIQTLAHDRNSFTLIFDENKTPDLSFMVFNISSGLFPINRKYVETEGEGIQKYGSNVNKFLTTGPFKIQSDEVIFGANGYLYLNKNKDYFDAENTLSDRIKIFFSTDKTSNTTLFEDGYVSQTFIPGTKINKFWSDPEFKKYLNKNFGYGTIAYGFNLDLQTNANSYIQDPDLRNAIYYAINREAILKTVGWEFSFPVNTWTAYGQYKDSDGLNIENYFDGQKAKAKNNQEFPVQNYAYDVRIAKGFQFENTERGDITHSPKTAEFYLNRFKQKHPDVKEVNLRYLHNTTDEQIKAGQYLKTNLAQMFNNFIKVDIKGLPENTYVDFVEHGKYDLVYQNFDRFGGSGASDYVNVFFKPDEIDAFSQKNIGMKDNPSGSYTYANYLSAIILEKLNAKSAHEVLLPYINEVQKVLKSTNLNNQVQKLVHDNSFYNKSQFVRNNDQKILDLIKNDLATANPNNINESVFAKEFLDLILESLLTNNLNIQTQKFIEAFNYYVINNFTKNEILQMTNETMQRLETSEFVWKEFISLAYQKNGENLSDYTSRINSFVSGNFTDEELEQGWTNKKIYDFILLLEKVIRDGAYVIPLMEVDTNWEITKIGGVSGLYKFALQYAYDFTNPPRPGLPRKRDT